LSAPTLCIVCSHMTSKHLLSWQHLSEACMSAPTISIVFSRATSTWTAHLLQALVEHTHRQAAELEVRAEHCRGRLQSCRVALGLFELHHPRFVCYVLFHPFQSQSLSSLEHTTSSKSTLRCHCLCCAVLCCAVLCGAVLCCAVLCCAMMFCAGDVYVTRNHYDVLTYVQAHTRTEHGP